MTYHVEVTDAAIVDAGEAYFWINESAPEAALRWYEGLLQSFRSLAQNPKRCAVAPESAFFDEEIRHLVYGRYRVLFSVKGRTVFVLRVRHSSRDYWRPDDETSSHEQ